MEVIIVGGGTVGVELANRILEKGHDVVLIERSRTKLDKISRNLDVMFIHGNGASYKILEQAGVRTADLLIAVTETDEVNMISCMLAKSYGVEKTVARVRNPDYTEETHVFEHDHMGIDIIINPELATAQEIAKIIRTPNAQGIEYFADGKIQMVGITVEEDSPVANTQIKDIKFHQSSNIVAILRKNRDVIIPHGTDEILPGDEIYIIGERGLLSRMGAFTRRPDKKHQNILVIGGGRVGYHVCRILEKTGNGMNVTLVEKDCQVCEDLAEDLSKTLVLTGDGTNLKFLQEEDLNVVDVMVATTGDDKTNLLSAIMSKKLGASRTIVELIKEDYEALLDTLQVDTVVSPRTITTAKILKLLRKEMVISMKLLGHEKIEVLELEVASNAPIVNKKLSETKLPQGVLIGAIVRNDQIIIPGGRDKIIPKDRVIVFVTSEKTEALQKFFIK